MHHDVVADQAHVGAALDVAVRDPAARHLADLGDVEHLQDQGIAEHLLAERRGQQSGHGRLHVIHEVVDDVVVADLLAVLVGRETGFLVGPDVEADDRGAGRLGERDVRFRDAADARVDDAGSDLVVAELLERGDDGLDRALHVALDEQRELLLPHRGELAHHVDERAAHRGAAGGRLLALHAIAILGDLAGTGLALHHGDAVARLGRTAEAEHLDREGRAGRRDRIAGVVEQRAHPAPLGTGHNDVADLQRAALHQHGGDGAAAAVEPRFHDRALGDPVRVRLEVEHLALQFDRLEQLAQVGLLQGGHLHLERVAAHAFDLHVVVQQLGADALGLGARLIDLVDRHDDRHAGRLGVVDRLDGLRHHAVVRRYDEDDQIGHLGAAGSHGREGRMARGVDEGDGAARRRGDLIGADMLGDAAGLARHDRGLPDRVEQRRLAVIDMAHDGDHGRTLQQVVVVAGLVEETFLDVRLGDAPHRMAEILGDELGHVGVDHIGDLGHVALLHQHLDHIHGPLRHAVGEILDRDGLGQHDLAGQLLLGLLSAESLHALRAATEGRQRTRAVLLLAGRRGHGQAAAVLLRTGARRTRHGEPRRRVHRRATDHRLKAALGTVRARGGRATSPAGARRQATARLLLGAALGLDLLGAARVFLTLTLLGGQPLGR